MYFRAQLLAVIQINANERSKDVILIDINKTAPLWFQHYIRELFLQDTPQITIDVNFLHVFVFSSVPCAFISVYIFTEQHSTVSIRETEFSLDL